MKIMGLAVQEAEVKKKTTKPNTSSKKMGGQRCELIELREASLQGTG